MRLVGSVLVTMCVCLLILIISVKFDKGRKIFIVLCLHFESKCQIEKISMLKFYSMLKRERRSPVSAQKSAELIVLLRGWKLDNVGTVTPNSILLKM